MFCVDLADAVFAASCLKSSGGAGWSAGWAPSSLTAWRWTISSRASSSVSARLVSRPGARLTVTEGRQLYVPRVAWDASTEERDALRGEPGAEGAAVVQAFVEKRRAFMKPMKQVSHLPVMTEVSAVLTRLLVCTGSHCMGAQPSEDRCE